MIQPSASFKDNLNRLPALDDLARIDLLDSAGATVATIENKPGKQGSLIVYNYLFQEFGAINAQAAAHGIALFAEHTADAKQRPGAHPNIDRLFEILDGGAALDVRCVTQ